MLDHAAKYTDKLRLLFLDISDDLKYQYLYSCSHREGYAPETSTWNKRELVSVSNGEVVGYFNYTIDRDSNAVHSLQIVNFTNDQSIVFSKDLIRFIKDIFKKYQHRKMSFTCFVDNPIIDSYRRLCKRFGGRTVGIWKEDSKLLDGEYHDLAIFEILRKDYLEAENSNKKNALQ